MAANVNFPMTLFKIDDGRGHAFVQINDLGVHLTGSDPQIAVWAARYLVAYEPRPDTMQPPGMQEDPA